MMMPNVRTLAVAALFGALATAPAAAQQGKPAATPAAKVAAPAPQKADTVKAKPAAKKPVVAKKPVAAKAAPAKAAPAKAAPVQQGKPAPAKGVKGQQPAGVPPSKVPPSKVAVDKPAPSKVPVSRVPVRTPPVNAGVAAKPADSAVRGRGQAKVTAPPTRNNMAGPATLKVDSAATRTARAKAKVNPDSAATKPIMREVFTYDAAGRRDPFASLMKTSELRPAISDLRLTGILYDPTGRRPIAVMRDLQTKAQYRVTTGMTLGRMRVSQIKPRSVIFSIEEFGINRQDSLVLGDSTKVRNP